MKVFKLFRNTSLLNKVIIPLIIINIISFITFFFLFRYMSEKEIGEKLNTDLGTINIEIENSYKTIREKSLMAATALAYNPAVVQAYEAYYTTYNLDSSSRILDKNIQQITNSLEKSFEEQIQIHFHTPPGISFYRSWINTKGDDLTSFRTSLNELYLTEKPVTGFESGRDGFVIRGIHPVFDENNTMLGSVEIFFPISEILKNIYYTNTKSVSFLMLKSSLNSFEAEEMDGNFKTVTNDFILLSDNYENIDLENINNDTLLRALEQPTFLRTENSGFLLKPIINFKGKAEGLIMYQIDITYIINHYKDLEFKAILILSVFFLITIILMLIISKNAVSKPVHQIIRIIEGLAHGEHNRRMKIKSQDEVGKIKKAINHLNENLINIESFAHEIGEGKFNATFKPRSKKDTLAFTLMDMKEKLQKAKEEDEKRRDEEKKREWQTQGVRLIYDILRENSQEGEELFYQVIAALVKYIKANQGGIFLIDNTEEYLELKGCYAYDRNKYFQKKVHIKEGLLGRCYQEKEYVNLTNLPESYMKIVSGVGEKSPDNLLLIPLMHDEIVKGVIELASFNKFEEYVIEFVQEITKQLSSALNDIEYSEKTRRLLDESRDKEQRLIQQDEEMRQNMEELKATQEQLERKQEQVRDIAQELEHEEISLREFLDKIKNM